MPSRHAPTQDSLFYRIMGWVILLGIVKTILETLLKR